MAGIIKPGRHRKHQPVALPQGAGQVRVKREGNTLTAEVRIKVLEQKEEIDERTRPGGPGA